MFRKFGIFLALVSAIATTQFPLGVVQVSAWLGMFSDYLEETGSLTTSLDWTFDGQHRCEGCDFVREQVAESEEPQETSFSGPTYLKLLLAPLVVEVPIVESPSVIGEITSDMQLLFCEVADLITPPPRFS